MISKSELNPKAYELTPEQSDNFEELYIVMNAIRRMYGKPMVVTSGVRSAQDQARINPAHPDDCHTKAAACDIKDGDRSLWGWCLQNLGALGLLGVYLEAKFYTPTWVHFQILPPKSGNRIFIP